MTERVTSGSTTTWRTYIAADGKLVAERFVSGSTVNMRYFVLDHLGSVAVITDENGRVLTDGLGNETGRQSYDPWGKMRHLDGSADTACALPAQSASTRGYTSQEQMPSVCTVNYNARIYDPELGRFMSADPTVEAPYNPQDLNRYTYVGDNPLAFTDPTGMCFLGCFWQQSWFTAIVAIVVVAILQQYEVLPAIGATLGLYTTSATLAAIVNAGILGGIAGIITTGTLKGAALGMLQGALFAEAGNLLQGPDGFSIFGSPTAGAFVAHGLVGGLVSVAGGGRFQSGFLAGGLSSFAPTPADGESFEEAMEGTAEAAVLGGAGSVLGGGKFQNGAETGAFSYLFNYCMHSKCWASEADLVAYKRGGPYGFWKSMCAGGDPIACRAMGAAANAPIDPLSLGTIARTWLETTYQETHATDFQVTPDGQRVPLDGQMTPEIEMQYSKAIADAYINYLGAGKWPSYLAIDQIHWSVNAQFGMPPAAFPATPLGTLAPNMFKWLICPKCAP